MPDATSPGQFDPLAAADEARTRELYEASQTFLLRQPDPRVRWLRWVCLFGILVFFFAGIPLMNVAGLFPDYKLNILGKYLCFAIVALGIDLIWGYTGLLSLCQALFFALGGYAMAMHLSLKEGGGDVRPEYNNIPQFMFFNNVHDLPGFWRPFSSMPFTIFAGLAVPGIVAAVFGFFILRSRVRGVYFSIVTQPLAFAAWLLISRNEMLLGGTNGLTNFYKPMSETRPWIISLYLVTLTVLVLAYLLCVVIVKSRLGRVLIAVRDKETRLYFAGYKPYAFKVFSFSVGAMLAGLGGMLYSPQVGIITPQDMNVEASIVLVVMVALGGRGKLWGAVFGALLLSVARSSLSSDMSATWLLSEGLIAVMVVLVFPDGFVGVWEKMERQLANGEGIGPAIITATPLAAVSLFVVFEGLGITPRPLNWIAHCQIYFNFKAETIILAIAGMALLVWKHGVGQKVKLIVIASAVALIVVPSFFLHTFEAMVWAALVGVGVGIWTQWRQRINWLVFLLAGAAAIVVPYLVLPTESTRMELQMKYVLLILAFVGAAVGNAIYKRVRTAPRPPRGFDVTVAEPALTAKEA